MAWVAFRIVKLWKSLLQEENGQNKIPLVSHFHLASSELQGSAGGPGHVMVVRYKGHLGVSNV